MGRKRPRKEVSTTCVNVATEAQQPRQRSSNNGRGCCFSLNLVAILLLIPAFCTSLASAFVLQRGTDLPGSTMTLHSTVAWHRPSLFSLSKTLTLREQSQQDPLWNLSSPSKPIADTIQDPHATTNTIVAKSYAPTFKQWKHRLITNEDPKHIHKFTGMLFLLSSWGLAGFGIKDLLLNGWTQTTSIYSKPFVVLLLTLVASSVAQASSSIRLACRHRKGQPAVRNTFMCNAAVAILGTVSALWSSPWYPAALNGAFSKAFYLVMDAIGLIGMADNLFRLKSLIASRQVSSKEKYNIDRMGCLQYWKDVFIYMMPILIGAPFFLGIGWQFGIRHNRHFYLEILETGCHPHLQTGAVYSMIMVAMGASYSSLIVTLRDKKLISKKKEGLSLTVVMLCLVGSLYQAMKDPGTIVAILGL